MHIFFLYSGVLSASIALASCGNPPGENESKMTSYTGTESKADTADLFTVPQDQMAHVKIATVEKSNFPRVLRFTGSVAYNAFKTTPVFSPVGGPVQEILVTPGQAVKAGQPLLTVTSPDYSAARSAYIKAKSVFLLADKNYSRAKDLYEHQAIAERDLQQAESDRAAAQADLVSSEDALRAVGVKDTEALLKNSSIGSGATPVLAPVSGEVTDRLVGPGQLLQVGATQCFTISDMSTVWVLMNVYQSDLAYVRVGDSVEISTDAYPEKFHGKVSYVAAALDPTTRTLQARIVTQNPAEKLKNNMYVTATVQAGAVKDALTVPDASVLRDTENQPFVYVLQDQNKFARRLVSVAEGGNGRTIITNGLKDGERVAGDGALFLQFKNSLQH
ncbi:MAG TPA: efflux RND transporter periplasmic adaptor subunit [Candidatus Dormibacteraeota bacterium]|jgi:cobalt-zinc-cadmium efflux system membrane fusion protein|nr:efflux RND transporter periplasmic adaptor subunit [Candidatus Dormibacteraeota bacterium]